MFEPALDHRLDHLGADVLVVVGRRNREVAFLVARPVAEIVALAARVPAAFFGINEVEAGVLVLVEADVVEDEELGFRAEIGGVRDAGILQILFRFQRHPSRIALVSLPRDRIDYIAGHHERSMLKKRIDESGRRVRDEEHITFVDGGPPTN